MASPDNILLYLTKEHEDYVRDLFAQLAAQGFPQQQQTPHITISFAPIMSTSVVELAEQLLPPLLPAECERRGIVVFGRKSKQTVAWLLETSDALETAARDISAANPEGRGPRWIPHLTVGLRLPKVVVPDYIAALDELTSPHFRTLLAERAGLWQSRINTLHEFR